jgi:AcrR family transcriptional regulator
MYSPGMPRAIPKDRFHDLIEAATAVFLEQGYRRTQMADVAARMGVAKGTVYLYVESKEALFDSVLRHADRTERIDLPDALPVPTPPPGATLEEVRKRVAENSNLSAVAAALARRRIVDVRSEIEAIVRELYALLFRQRVGIKLLDRCATDYPELAAIWFATGREGAVELLRRYLEDRIRRGLVEPVEDPAISARMVLETAVFWAVHRHWDPSPRTVDESVVETAVVDFVVRALLGSARIPQSRRRAHV